MLIRIASEPLFWLRILWYGEATFKINGRANSHNSIYWSGENSHEVISQELNVYVVAFGVVVSYDTVMAIVI